MEARQARQMDQLPADNIPIRRFIFGIATGIAVIVAVWVAVSREDSSQITTASEASEAVADRDTGAAAINTIAPSFDVVRISPGGTGVVAGRAAPGSVVELYSDDNLLASEEADGNGEWVMILDEPMEVGPVELSLSSRLADAEPVRSVDIVILSIPARSADRFVQAAPDGVIALLTPRDGSGASRVLQRPGGVGGAVAGDSVAIDTVDYDSLGSIIISGRASPRALLAVYLNNDFIGSVRAGDEGEWSIAPASTLDDGENLIRIDQVVFEGDVEFRIEQPFVMGTPIDTSLGDRSVIVRAGNSLWHIARRIYGSGFRYTLIFQENADQIRNPDLIYPGQVFSLPNESASVETPPGGRAERR